MMLVQDTFWWRVDEMRCFVAVVSVLQERACNGRREVLHYYQLMLGET